MKRALVLATGLIALIAGGVPAMANALTVGVPATGDLYLSGQPSGTICCAGDSAPTNSPTLAAIALISGDYLTFTTAGSATNQPGPVYATADGNTDSTYNLHADYGTGISGPTNIHLAALAGVFVGDGTPTGLPPGQLTGTTFTTVSPELDQIFFIGDGLTGTGSGSVQTFYVPEGATRLFLGVADDGGYYDNSGTIIASITQHAISAAPEPSTWALMLGGLATIGGMLRIANARRRENEVAGIATA